MKIIWMKFIQNKILIYNILMDDTDKTLYKTIYKKNKSRELQKVKIYNGILNKCEKKIKWYANNDKYECYFEIPKFTPGAPLYDINECAYFILQKLKTKFKVHYFTPNDLKTLGIDNNINDMTGIIYISWIHIKEKLNKKFY